MRQETREKTILSKVARSEVWDKWKRAEVACLRERKQHLKAAVDKRRRMGQDDEQCARLWEQSWEEATKSQNCDSADENYKLAMGKRKKDVSTEVALFFTLTICTVCSVSKFELILDVGEGLRRIKCILRRTMF